MENRTWLVKASEKKCNHRNAFKDLGMISWRMDYAKFSVGDVVYIYFTDTKQVEVKAEVLTTNTQRVDAGYWNENAPDDICATFKKISCKINEPALGLVELLKHGYKTRSAQRPMYNNPELFEYLDLIFERN